MSRLELLPLGGLGEFGMNAMWLRHGDSGLLIDAGLAFADAIGHGVDRIVPARRIFDDGPLDAIVLTHGHEDHIGALPHLLEALDVPVYATRFTLALVRRRLAEAGIAPRERLRPLPEPGESFTVGPFTIDSIPVPHSIPQTRMIVVETPAGRVVHSADFKLGDGADLEALERAGAAGVDLLLVDSTGADLEGRTPPESVASAALAETIESARGTVVVCTFSSHVERVGALARIAQRCDRRLMLLGASLRSQLDLAAQEGLLRWPPGLRSESGRDLPRDGLLVVAAGSQGEPASAMARIADDNHPELRLAPGDLLIHSARMIPGREAAITAMLDGARRRGAEVITAADRPVHVSGHPRAGDLTDLFELLRPTHVVAIHGEYHQLAAARSCARAWGLDAGATPEVESGDRILLADGVLRVERGERPPTTLLESDGRPLPWEALHARRWLAHSGTLLISAAIDPKRRRFSAPPSVEAIGIAPLEGDREILLDGVHEVVRKTLGDLSAAEWHDRERIEQRLTDAVRRFVRRRAGRQPMIVPTLLFTEDSNDELA